MIAFDWLQSFRSPLRLRVRPIRKPRARRHARQNPGLAAAVDVLEDRTLLATYTVSGGHVTIEGTEGDDDLNIVSIDNIIYPDVPDGEQLPPLYTMDIRTELYELVGGELVGPLAEIINWESMSVDLKGGDDSFINNATFRDRYIPNADTPDDPDDSVWSPVFPTVAIQGGAGDDDLYYQGNITSIDGGPHETNGRDTINIGEAGLPLIRVTNTSVMVEDPADAEEPALIRSFQNFELVFLHGTDGGDTLTAAEGTTISISFSGGGGADTITGGDGNDILSGGDGTDIIHGGKGSDSIYGAYASLADGSNDRDELYGDEGNDSIEGGGGNDLIRGGAGVNSLWGDDGDDEIHGGPDSDHLWGGPGADMVFGYEGDDNFTEVDGDAANILDGASGDDEFRVSPPMTSLAGGEGFDTLLLQSTYDATTMIASPAPEGVRLQVDADEFVATSIDYLWAWMRNEAGSSVTINALPGVSRIGVATDAGNDQVEVHLADSVQGDFSWIETSDGNDTIDILIENALTNPALVEVTSGEGTDDTVRLTGSGAAEQFYVTQIVDSPLNPEEEIEPGGYLPEFEALADALLTAEAPQDVRDFGGYFVHSGKLMLEVSMDADDKVETFEIAAGNGGGVIQGRLDQFEDGVILDSLVFNGGDQTDRLDVSQIAAAALPGTTALSGRMADDHLIGRDGMDELVGGADDDLLIGNGGDDTLKGEADQDFLIGDGFDLSEQDWAALEVIARSLLDGGQNTLELALTPQGSGIDTIEGGDGDDFIIGGNDKDIITAGEGNALIYGDEMTVAPQISVDSFWSDPLVVLDLIAQEGTLSGEGDDIITGSATHSNVIVGGSGVDTITGGATSGQWDFLFGNDGRDSLRGQDGNNVLVGGSNPVEDGQETLNGGNDFDLIVGDRFTFSAEADFDFSTLFAAEPELAVELMAGFALTGSGEDAIQAGDGVNLVFGGAGDDHITGGNGALDALFGNGGDDRIGGLNKTNVIFGGDGSDPALLGGDDADLILGDDLTVSATLSFDLTQLLAGEVPVAFAAALQDAGTGDDTIDTGGGLNFVWGGAGNDTVDGGDGALDMLFGNDGRDTIRAANGTNLIVGGDHDDPELKGGDGVDVILGDSLEFKRDEENNPEEIDLPEASADSVTTFFRQSVGLFTAFGLAGEGIDDIQAGNGFNFVLGGAGNDTIRGGNSWDVLYGHGGEDTIFGGDGTGIDLIVGGDDKDILAGHLSTESFAEDGPNIIFGDNVSLDVSFDPGFLVGEKSWPTLNAGLMLTGSGWDEIYGGDDFDFLVGGDGEDDLYGRDGFNIAFGDDFSQATAIVDFAEALVNPFKTTELIGEALYEFAKGLVYDNIYSFFFGSEENPDDQKDSYEGGTGIDLVFGGGGKDNLKGGAGFDILAGGGDDDEVDVGPPEEGLPQGTWGSFGFGGPGNDSIVGGSGNDILGSTIGDDVVRGGDGNDVIVGGEQSDQLYGDDGDDSLFAQAGNDLLVGGPGSDLLSGGSGDDTYESDAGDVIVDEDGGALPVAAIDFMVNGDDANHSGIHELTMIFSEPITVDTATSLNLFNHTTGQSIDLSAATLVNNGTTSVTWDVSGVAFDDGRYTAELLASATTPALAQTHTFEFHKLAGDVNGDGVVSNSDYRTVNGHFGSITGGPFRPGDANGDGVVSNSDYRTVNGHFGTVLPAIELDFGDAPGAAAFPTTLVQNGPRHAISGNSLVLGAGRDAETDGLSSADAGGDGADDDGIQIGALEVGASAEVTATVAGMASTAFLNGWIDFNGDGDWDDAGEQVFVDQSLANDVNVLSVAVPSDASPGAAIARFRLTQSPGYSIVGLAPQGEVEDYLLTIVEPPPPIASTPQVTARTATLVSVAPETAAIETSASAFPALSAASFAPPLPFALFLRQTSVERLPAMVSSLISYFVSRARGGSAISESPADSEKVERNVERPVSLRSSPSPMRRISDAFPMIVHPLKRMFNVSDRD